MIDPMKAKTTHGRDAQAASCSETDTTVSDTIPLPKKFPAKLKDFLRLVVCARTEADATKRLRDFYRDELRRWFGKPKLLDTFTAVEIQALRAGGTVEWRCDTNEIEERAAAHVKGWKEAGFGKEGGQQKWEALARRYQSWWKEQLSAKRREAGKKGTASGPRKTT